MPVLEKLVSEGHEIPLVVSRPDRPSGRGRKILPTPVKSAAVALGLRVAQYEDVNAPEAVAEISFSKPDSVVVVAFGQILKKEILELPRYGCVNLHASLLPLLRGAAPINRAIMDGLSVTGVTTMKMNRRMDAGEMYLKAEIPIGPRTTAGDLEETIKTVGPGLMAETLRGLANGSVTATAQDESLVTLAKKIDPMERPIDWADPAIKIDRQIRGLSPAHCAFTFFRGARILILRSEAAAGPSDQPGLILNEGLEVGTGNGRLAILEVRPEGKTAMRGADWARGARVVPNRDCFEVKQ